jgi:hypothetical protein
VYRKIHTRISDLQLQKLCNWGSFLIGQFAAVADFSMQFSLCLWRYPMQLQFWINAFIPGVVSGYTQAITKGTHVGKTAIPLPFLGRFHPGNTLKPLNTGYLTDQRSFSSDPSASARMRSIVAVDLTSASCRPMAARHETSGTTEVDIATGAQLGFGMADMSRCTWQQAVFTTPIVVGSTYLDFGRLVPISPGFRPPNPKEFFMDLVAKAGDPLVAGAADIDFEGRFSVWQSGVTPNVLTVTFTGMLDSFPAYEAYATYGGVTKTLFRSAPPAGNTVMDLLGRATRPVSGIVRFA